MSDEIASTSARKDLAIIAAVVLLVAVFSYAFDFFEQIRQFAERFEQWEVDEVIVILFTLALGMVWYSARRQIENRHLLDIQNNFIRAFEEASEAIVIMDRHAIVEFSNRAYTTMTGYGAGELAGQLFPMVDEHPDVWVVVQDGRAYQGKIEVRRKDGSTFPATVSIAPIFNAQSEVAHYVLIQGDMRGYEEMESQIRQMQKMDALGLLVGGVAHDFNNLLSGMMSNAFLAKSELPARSKATDYIEIIEKLIRSGADTVRQLLTFSRKSSAQMKPLQLNQLMGEWFGLARKGVPERVKMEMDSVDMPLPVLADGVQLQQMMLNLINNASDAVREMQDAKIRIEIGLCYMDDALRKRHPELIGDAFALICVEDNGCGISKEHMEHLFEPFFTTKEMGQGTGIGLATVYGTVKSHQGAIEVDSQPGKGARFSVYLPLTEGFSDEQEHESGAVAGAGEKILLADDDSHVRNSLEQVLRALDYEVVPVRTGVELTNAFREHADGIALVIADVAMPEQGGVEAMSEIRAVYPAKPVIFISGYDISRALDVVESWSKCKIHPKPVSVELISRQVKELISGSATR